MNQEEQQTHCPRCGKTDTVRRKLLTAPWKFETPQAGDGHLSIREPEEAGNSLVIGDFIKGYYCDACGSGFVTDEMLRSVGLSEQEILSQRYCFTPPRGTWKK